MSKEPESPRKMEAGLKLYRRKPIRHPASGAVASASMTSPWSRAAMRVVRVAAKPTPVARPSTPSIRLNALQQRISHAMVIRQPHQGGRGCPAKRSEEHRLNSSHLGISYAVFCLKKKKK